MLQLLHLNLHPHKMAVMIGIHIQSQHRKKSTMESNQIKSNQTAKNTRIAINAAKLCFPVTAP